MSMKALGTKNCHLGDKERPPLIGTSDLWLSGAIVPWRVTINQGLVVLSGEEHRTPRI